MKLFSEQQRKGCYGSYGQEKDRNNMKLTIMAFLLVVVCVTSVRADLLTCGNPGVLPDSGFSYGIKRFFEKYPPKTRKERFEKWCRIIDFVEQKKLYRLSEADVTMLKEMYAIEN